MPNYTVKQIKTNFDLGNAAVGDYFVGQKLGNSNVTGTLTFAPKLNMDPTPSLAANLTLNGFSITGNLSVNNFSLGTNASASTYLRGDGTWVNPATSTGGVNAGTINQFAYYAAGGNILSGRSDVPAAVLSGLGTNVLTFLQTPTSANLASALTDETGTGANVFANAPTFIAPVLGTPGSGTLTNCTGLSLTTGVTGNLPVTNLNNGTGANSGSFWRGDGTWAAPSGSGTVNSGTANQLAYYSGAGTAVSGLTTANNGILVTSGTGVPSISTTLPTGLALQTPTSAVLTNATGLPITTGVSGLGTGVATALTLAVGTGGGAFVRTSSGAATSLSLTTPILGVATGTSLNFGASTDGIIGTTTNNAATAGSVGEVLTNTGTATALTTGVATNLASISVSAGDYLAWASCQWVNGGSTVVAQLNTSVSTTSGTMGGNDRYNRISYPNPTSFGAGTCVINNTPPIRISLASTTTVYAVCNSAFTVSTMTATGTLTLKRIR